DELRARGAHPLEARPAGRAKDVVLLYAFLTRRADDALLGFSRQAFLSELTLVGLPQRLLRTHDEIQEQSEDVERDDEQAREIREHRILCALLRVANGPEDHREIQREDVETDAADRELDERVVDERRPHSTEIGHCLDLRPEPLRVTTHAVTPIIEQVGQRLLERDLRLPSGRALELRRVG